MPRATILAIAIVTWASEAWPQAVKLQNKDRTGVVFVLRDEKALSEAIALARAGNKDISLLAPLVACVVPSGTPAIVLGRGIGYRDVLVTEGSEKGCRGAVVVEQVSN